MRNRTQRQTCIKIAAPMTNRTIAQWAHYYAARRRLALTCLLLLTIAWQSSIETAHSHGHIQPAAAATDVAAVSDAGSSNSSPTARTQQTECSVCQFQQQLFNALVNSPLSSPVSSPQLTASSSVILVDLSTSTRTPSGRAPPLPLHC